MGDGCGRRHERWQGPRPRGREPCHAGNRGRRHKESNYTDRYIF
ncbi:hypothetical protein ALSL_1311 [Aerosticca soli]|uniref:Uncharacterized protein n=1 Tax=Aerosticca soli TaxID=2010829 RepID=A0A2Z6E666_9GAMM|nr:hypothetical protein ALSL_1311 [Aerosticca soli]